jgi:hypothetical protein
MSNINMVTCGTCQFRKHLITKNRLRFEL